MELKSGIDLLSPVIYIRKWDGRMRSTAGSNSVFLALPHLACRFHFHSCVTSLKCKIENWDISFASVLVFLRLYTTWLSDLDKVRICLMSGHVIFVLTILIIPIHSMFSYCIVCLCYKPRVEAPGVSEPLFSSILHA